MRLASVREALQLKAGRFLETHLPVRMKRLVCLASLGAFVNGATSLDDSVISKLNALMVLGNNDQALKLPVLLSRAIWNGKILPITILPFVQVLNAPSAASVSAEATQAMPNWLRYGEDTLIRQEIEKLLDYCSNAMHVVQPA